MAFKTEEIKRLETMADEMAKLIEDADNTSSEATVVYGKIGRACARALSNVAAATAKQSERDKHVLKFQSARETRKQKKSGTQAQTPPSATRPERLRQLLPDAWVTFSAEKASEKSDEKSCPSRTPGLSSSLISRLLYYLSKTQLLAD